MIRGMFLFSFFCLLFFTISTNCDQKVSARVKNGLIYGRKEWFEGRDLSVFLGIPYAEPPINGLRFKRPVPTGQWSEPIEALEWPNSCVHKRFAKVESYFSARMSEDCLYLNVWSPVTQGSEDSLKPVMFFIHGGGFNFGSSSEETYSGHVLASKGEVVVVTINYRLNVFGTLYTGTDIGPGNMGLWDQTLALEWVNDNIKYFGGDPTRITLFGESAGAWSTSLHILSPVSRNLFQNAIVMSGAAINNVSVCAPEAVLEMWITRARSIGCVDNGNIEQTNKKFTNQMIDCLVNASPEVLANIPTLHMRSCMPSFLIDGQFLTDRPINLLRSGDHKQHFNLMVGTTEDEGSFLLPLFYGHEYDFHSPEPISYNQAYNNLVRIVNDLPFGADGQQLAKVYFAGLSDQSDGDLLRRTIGIALGDYFHTCPTTYFAKSIYSSDPRSKVFEYYYNSKVGDPNRMFCSQWMGCCHFNEIYPVFGVPFYQYHRYVDKERQISDQMIAIFSSFAKTGRPQTQDSSEWQSFYRVNDQIIAPFYEITAEPKVDINFGLGLKLTECEYAWNQFIIV